MFLEIDIYSVLQYLYECYNECIKHINTGEAKRSNTKNRMSHRTSIFEFFRNKFSKCQNSKSLFNYQSSKRYHNRLEQINYF